MSVAGVMAIRYCKLEENGVLLPELFLPALHRFAGHEHPVFVL